MGQQSTERERFNWRLPLYVVVGASMLLLLLFMHSADAGLLYILVVAPIVCLFCLVLLLMAAISKRPLQCLSMLVTLIAFLAVSAALFKAQGTLRPALRWLVWSRRYKAEVMRMPDSSKGELKHLEWDVSGWGTVGRTIVYLVFDPTDSLSTAAQSHKAGHFIAFSWIV